MLLLFPYLLFLFLFFCCFVFDVNYPLQILGLSLETQRFPVTPKKIVSQIIYRPLWLGPWIHFLSLFLFPSLPPVSFRPRSERWLWYLAHLMDRREEMQASQNKLYNKLLAGGKKLCTHNLLMVCKLRAEFAPSSILQLSPPLFSSIPSSPWNAFSLSHTISWKELQRMKAIKSLKIWSSKDIKHSCKLSKYFHCKKVPNLLQTNSNFILWIIVNSSRSVNSIDTPHKSSLSHIIFLLPHLFAWMTNFRLKERTDLFSKCPIHIAAPTTVIAPYTDDFCFPVLVKQRRNEGGRESHALCVY